MILVRWIHNGKEGEKEFPDEQLDEILERCWRRFGDINAKPLPSVEEINAAHRKRAGAVAEIGRPHRRVK